MIINAPGRENIMKLLMFQSSDAKFSRLWVSLSLYIYYFVYISIIISYIHP